MAEKVMFVPVVWGEVWLDEMLVTLRGCGTGVVEISFEYGPAVPAVLYARTARKYLTDGLGSKKSNVATFPTSIVVVY
jgi:hypothetical protein